MSFLTAELSMSIPTNSGMIQWTNVAYGRFSRFFTSQVLYLLCNSYLLQAMLMSSVIAVTDNSIYPALFVDYLTEIVPLTGLAQVQPFFE